ncbi:MAG: 3-dehydroquinate synthase [Myxococcales bacterium FL481]|nr:MAG: 3-dehydroquinate synthase [Myxococcales bacterium FL481]
MSVESTNPPSNPPRRRTGIVKLAISVPEEDMSYPVLVGTGLAERLPVEIKKRHPQATRVALISDDNVMPLHGERMANALRHEGLEVTAHAIVAGEASKTPEQLLRLVELFVEAKFTRKDVVVAVGGGVVGDLAGTAAALFMRGIPIIQCPTSLLAQVDASVGGKVAVDLPSGKNLLGTFHFPSFVLIDPLALKTLPDRELACGLAEMLKHGLLFSEEHADAVVAASETVFARDSEALVNLIATSVALKSNCVSRDPREQAPGGRGRAALNLGHTVGHALESVSNYELRHGEAVALGLVAAARVSERKGLCGPGLEDHVVAALRQLRLPVDLDQWLDDERAPKIERALVNDKKREPYRLHYIALVRVGEACTLTLSPAEIIALLRT